MEIVEILKSKYETLLKYLQNDNFLSLLPSQKELQKLYNVNTMESVDIEEIRNLSSIVVNIANILHERSEILTDYALDISSFISDYNYDMNENAQDVLNKSITHCKTAIAQLETWNCKDYAAINVYNMCIDLMQKCYPNEEHIKKIVFEIQSTMDKDDDVYERNRIRFILHGKEPSKEDLDNIWKSENKSFAYKDSISCLKEWLLYRSDSRTMAIEKTRSSIRSKI